MSAAPGTRLLAVAVSPDVVVLGPTAARWLLQLLEQAERMGRRDGIGLPPQLRTIRDQLALIAPGVPGQEEQEFRRSAESSQWAQDEIGTSEAALILGVTRERVNQLARGGRFGATRVVSGRRLVSRSLVTAVAEERNDP